MARSLLASIVLTAGAVALHAQTRPDVIATQQQLQFHSAFWPNLHSVLWAEAWARRPAKPGEPSPGPIEACNANVWHPAFFYSTGEVLRQALESRGVKYVPYVYATGMFDRSWPRFKSPIETHWKAFVDGQLTRDEAIQRIVGDLK